MDTYGKWLPIGNKAAVDRLDAGPAIKKAEKLAAAGESGSRVVAKPGSETREPAEGVEKDGGPCRDRTCGPLIKSQLLYQLS